ncbi:BTB/POZ domain-containing protein 9 [Portunus trituberculatus]|uniref:BTB/POZ domain-containing protein 9 n=1 Tax=Portunus trituberculatus TaxID=210409 RepID=A0A5B7DAG8_PORTR|nr:BTB/POZ domain-containing protein 9 [Portunus trituberculatus]
MASRVSALEGTGEEGTGQDFLRGWRGDEEIKAGTREETGGGWEGEAGAGAGAGTGTQERVEEGVSGSRAEEELEQETKDGEEEGDRGEVWVEEGTEEGAEDKAVGETGVEAEDKAVGEAGVGAEDKAVEAGVGAEDKAVEAGVGAEDKAVGEAGVGVEDEAVKAGVGTEVQGEHWRSRTWLLLWDCDDRSYSYYIEASVNNRDWELIVDKTREACRSWQTLTFAPRAIVYFKIVGTFNTANEVFHCVHFEAPAQVGSENRPRVKGFDHAVAPVRPHPSGGSIEDGRGSPASVEAVVMDSNLVALEAGPVRERLGSTARSDHSEESRMREEGAVGRVRDEGAVGRVEEGSVGRVREDVGVGARRREERDVRTRAREENRAGRRGEDTSAGERVKEQCPRPQTPLPEVVVVPEPKARHPRHHCLQDDSDDDEEEESKDK